MIKILLAEQNTELSDILSAALRAQNYDVIPFSDGESAAAFLAGKSVQLIVADCRCGGMELTQELRESGNITPVILLTDLSTGQQKRRIFRSGADGYMVEPVDPEELQMRVSSLLWRCRIVDEAMLQFGRCRLCAHTLTVETPDADIELRRMEFMLLEKLLSYPGRVFTRAQLMDELWGFDSQSDPRTVDTHIKLLRKKLKDVEDIRIQTVRGLGYRAVMPRRLRKQYKAE